jgi:hypothetical protein
MEKIASKPRLAENEDSCWAAIYEKIKEYKGHGLVVIEVFGLGLCSLNAQNKWIKMKKIPDKSMYWGYLPIYQLLTSAEKIELSDAIAKDQADIWFEPYSKHQDAKCLHKCSGKNWLTTVKI